MTNLMTTLRRHWEVWLEAWKEQSRQPPANVPRGREAEFLPAVLEVQDSPPSPLGRAVTWTIITALGSGILWASLGRIDIVAVAPGKIIPSDYSKVIQPLESGVIRAIAVRDGQAVEKGKVLIELDATGTTADKERLANELQSARVEAARLRALLAGQADFDPPQGADPQLVALQRRMLRDQSAEQLARVDAAQQLIEQRRASAEATKANITRLETTVPMSETRANAYRQLRDKQYVSEVEYLALEQERVEQTQELAKQRELLTQDQAALAEARNNYEALRSEFQKARQGELAAAETKAASLAQEVVKAGQRTGQQTLTAPINGVVQQLAVHTVGGVVTPAQQLMVVVPHGHQLEAEAWVENKDIGFVKAGQPVEIKVEAFPFTRYGVIDGRLVSVSNDAVPQEKGGLVYAARVEMGRRTVQVEDKLVNLSPGMAITVEIKTEQRRLIEFFLSPLLQSLKESMRER